MTETITAEVQTAADYQVDRDPDTGRLRIFAWLGEAGHRGQAVVHVLDDDTAAQLALALCDVVAAGPGGKVAVAVPPVYSPGRIREALLPALRAQRAAATDRPGGGR